MKRDEIQTHIRVHVVISLRLKLKYTVITLYTLQCYMNGPNKLTVILTLTHLVGSH